VPLNVVVVPPIWPKPLLPTPRILPGLRPEDSARRDAPVPAERPVMIST